MVLVGGVPCSRSLNNNTCNIVLEYIFIVALISYGWCSCFWPEMIFEKIGDWLEARLPEIITKPLFSCPICNAFWTGTIMYWTLFGNDPVDWLIISIGAAGVNAIVVNLINKLEDISE